MPGLAVEADLDDPASLTRALAGADALLAVTFDPLRDTHDAHLLAAARRAGVRHVVKVSALAVTDPRAQDAITRWQRACEERVRASGMSWTLLRPARTCRTAWDGRTACATPAWCARGTAAR
ncbi:NAD(P)H-binding protein [Streptomyces zhihengii]